MPRKKTQKPKLPQDTISVIFICMYVKSNGFWLYKNIENSQKYKFQKLLPCFLYKVFSHTEYKIWQRGIISIWGNFLSQEAKKIDKEYIKRASPILNEKKQTKILINRFKTYSDLDDFTPKEKERLSKKMIYNSKTDISYLSYEGESILTDTLYNFADTEVLFDFFSRIISPRENQYLNYEFFVLPMLFLIWFEKQCLNNNFGKVKFLINTFLKKVEDWKQNESLEKEWEEVLKNKSKPITQEKIYYTKLRKMKKLDDTEFIVQETIEWQKDKVIGIKILDHEDIWKNISKTVILEDVLWKNNINSLLARFRLKIFFDTGIASLFMDVILTENKEKIISEYLKPVSKRKK